MAQWLERSPRTR